MGPKKKKDEAVAVEAETPDQIEWKNLKTDADRLHKITKKEDADFNEFQQQREKLNYFWIVEKKKLEDKRAELRNKDRELQDLEEKHQVEIKIYKQRLKHLLLEHQNEISNKKTESEIAQKMAQDDNRELILDVKEDRRHLTMVIKEIELTHEEYIRSLKRDQDQKITALRHEFERKASEVQKTYEARMKKTRDGLDKTRKEEIKAIEDRKHVMIDQLMSEHQKAFADIKNYYNDITHNNLDLIKSLKEEVKELEAEERKDQLRLNEKMAENKKLTAPLKRMQEELVRLTAEYEDYKKEKAEMKRIKGHLSVVENDESKSSWEYETLIQRFADLSTERNELKSNLQASVFDIKQKSTFRTLLLEKKLAAMNRVQEERQAQMNEVLTRANLDPTVMGQVRGEVEDIMQAKNGEARRLHAEVARLQALQEQFNLSIQIKMREYGFDITELGFSLPNMAIKSSDN